MLHDLMLREHAAALETREALARPNTWNGQDRTIEAVVASSAPVARRDARGEFDEVLDIGGCDVEALRGAHVLDAHQRNGGVASVIGTVEDAWREGERLISRLRLSSRPELAGIVRDIADGVITSLSLGYEVAEWRDGESSGRRTKTATRWTPREVSFVPVAADPTARTRSLDPPRTRAAINRSIRELASRAGVAPRVADDLIDSGATIDQARAALFDQMVSRSNLHIRASVGESYDQPRAVADAVGDALYARMSGSAPTAPARPFMHRSMLDLARELSGDRSLLNAPDAEVARAMLQRSAMTSTDFPSLLGALNVAMDRRLGDLFRAAESGASAIAAPGTARDFRPISEGRMTSFPELERVNEDGEIRFGALTEEGETLAIASYAKGVRVTFQLLVNDDLNAINRSVQDIAFATARLKAKLIIAALTAKMRDGKTLFHADHKNLAAAGAAPGITSLSQGRLAMQKQSPPGDDEPLGLSPGILLVPGELQTRAEQLVAAITAARSSEVNVFAGKLQVAVEPRLVDPLAWFLFAAPGTYPVIRLLTLAGYESPRFEVQAEFNTLGTSYRVHWHVGAGPVDHRGAWKNPGAEATDGLEVIVTNAADFPGA